MLPTFEVSIGPAVAAAEAAEAAGLDGIFAFDHLWPIGHPGLPSLSMFPVLAAAAERDELDLAWRARGAYRARA